MRTREQMGYMVGLAIGSIVEGGGRLLRRARRTLRDNAGRAAPAR